MENRNIGGGITWALGYRGNRARARSSVEEGLETPPSCSTPSTPPTTTFRPLHLGDHDNPLLYSHASHRKWEPLHTTGLGQPMAQQWLAYLERLRPPSHKQTECYLDPHSACCKSFPSLGWRNELLSHRLHFPATLESPSPAGKASSFTSVGDCGRCLSTNPLSFETHTPHLRSKQLPGPRLRGL